MSGTERFEALLERYSALMASAVRRVCGRRGRALVPDIQQEIRLALWKRLQGGNPIDHPASYIYKVALTTAAAVLRKQGPAREEVDMPAEGTRDGAHEPRRLQPVERQRLLEQSLAALPDDQARALRAYLAGFNHGEIARMYGWTEAVARHRVYRGIESLRPTDGEDRRGR